MLSKSYFSGDNLHYDLISEHHEVLEKSLRAFYSPLNPMFIGYTPKELNNELTERLDELERASSFTILSSIEAALRVDYLQRCDARRKDSVSTKFLKLYREKGLKANLEEEILEVWKQELTSKWIISEVRGAFKYRHWLAHGRYWKNRLKKYDFIGLYVLAAQLQTEFNVY